MNVQINWNQPVRKIKPMHAVGQPPFTGGFCKLDFTPMQILQDAHIPFSRLHDVGGPFGGNRYVDIPNIFRDFDADENAPESYDFAFTDELIRALVEYGIAPYFRLGVTIENQCQIKSYRIHPPKDYGKWARICEHIVRHYNDGWANGFYFGIQYWEIWNEPENGDAIENNQMWTGTAEQYYALYDVTAKHLKACFGDKIKVGGYSASGLYGLMSEPQKYGLSISKRNRPMSTKDQYRIDFLYGFLNYIKKNRSPIDFFSWHAYGDVEFITAESDFIHRTLCEYGYEHLETHLTEWNLSHDRKINRNTLCAPANVMATMIAMQHKKTDKLMYYDAEYVSVSAYGGFYDLTTYEPSSIYYAFKAFGELYTLGHEVECICSEDGIYGIAAKNEEKMSIILSNIKQDVKVNIDLQHGFSVYLIDKTNLLTKMEWNPMDFVFAKNTIVVIKNF